jgi:nucleotide-binding universal stress UspA family protein
MSDDYRILVAIDLETGTDRLLAEAQHYAKALNAVVDLLHVGAPEPDFVPYIKGTNYGLPADIGREDQAKELRSEHQQIQAIAASFRAAGIRVDQALMIQGSTLATILDEVGKRSADLLILGSHHHGALHRFWFGDTAASAAKKPPCALLVVPV